MNQQSVKTVFIENQSMASQIEKIRTETVVSQDGTSIRYLKIGRGPGVVMLHGAMESARSHLRLAQALADAFTVYLPERRGHSLSGPVREDYSIQKEVEDLDALLAKTGAHNLFGVSAGGLICLQAGLSLPAIHKIALYEPALIVNGSASTAFLPRYDQEIVQGKVAAALVTSMKEAQLGPAVFNLIPRWLLERLTSMMMEQEEKNAEPGDMTMRRLAPTLHYDFELVAEMAETVDKFKALHVEVLLLGGSQSPAWLKAGLDALDAALPTANRIEFPGLNHGGSSDVSTTNRDGHPEVVAQRLRQFFEGLGQS